MTYVEDAGSSIIKSNIKTKIVIHDYEEKEKGRLLGNVSSVSWPDK